MHTINDLIERGQALKIALDDASQEQFLALLTDIESWQSSIANHSFAPQTTQEEFAELQALLNHVVKHVDSQRQMLSEKLVQFRKEQKQDAAYRDVAQNNQNQDH